LSFEFGNQSDKITNNIVFIMDLSHSMNVEDIKWDKNQNISRLDLIKQFISNTFNNQPEWNFWLILFSQKSNYFIPPTADLENFKNYIEKLNTNFLPAWWSNIYEWLKNFIEYSDKWTIWVLISDMWDSIDFNDQKNKINNLKEEYIKKQLKLIIIWVWTEKWWVVKYPNWEQIINKAQSINSNRNNEFGRFIASTFNTNYIEIETIKETDKVSILNNNINIINDKHKKYIEFAASLFGIFWL